MATIYKIDLRTGQLKTKCSRAKRAKIIDSSSNELKIDTDITDGTDFRRY